MSVENQAAIELSEQELDVVAGGTQGRFSGETFFDVSKLFQFSASESNAQGSKVIGFNFGNFMKKASFLDMFFSNK